MLLDAPTSTGNRTRLGVVSQNLGFQARRRIARHARAAIRQSGAARVVEVDSECVDVDDDRLEPGAPLPIHSRRDNASDVLRDDDDDVEFRPSSQASKSSSKRLTARLACRSRPALGSRQAWVNEVGSAVETSFDDVQIVSVNAGSREARSRTPASSRRLQSGSLHTSASSRHEIVSSPSTLGEGDAHFFIEHFEHGAWPRSCGACREFFVRGHLRLGFTTATTETSPMPTWIHASPRCIRRANFIVQLTERLAFSLDVTDFNRAVVLEELGAQHSRQTGPGWPGAPTAALSPTQPWLHAPPAVGAWSFVLVPDHVTETQPESVPVLAALAGRTASFAARAAALDARLAEADRAMAPTGDLIVQALADVGVHRPDSLREDLPQVRAELSLVPVQRLEKEAETCMICQEPMRNGEEVRRLPCFHLFHRSCLDRWFLVKPTCPLDNLKLRDMLSAQESISTADAQ